jgi:hypothetical protein
LPVSVTLQPPATGFGPGIAINVHTDLVGPIPSGASWILNLFGDTDQTQLLGQGFGSASQHDRLFRPYTNDFQTTWIVSGSSTLTAQAHPTIQASLRSSTNQILDQGVTSFPTIDTTSGLGTQILLNPQGSGQGFTEADRTDLQTTKQNTTDMGTNWNEYETITLPSLSNVLQTISASVTAVIGAGAAAVSVPLAQLLSLRPLQDLVETNLSSGVVCTTTVMDLSLQSLYGLEVHITDYPDDWQFVTPDHQWGHHDLAVLELRMGSQLVLRHGIHTLTHTIRPIPTYPLPWLFFIPTSLQPVGLTATIYFAQGVCGEVIGQLLP